MNIGEQFTVSVHISAGVQPVDGAAVYINFDPTQIQNQYHNLAGHIDYAYGTFSNFLSGTLELLEVTFEAIDGSEESLLQFNMIVPRLTGVTYEVGFVLADSISGTMSIVEGVKAYLPLILRNTINLEQTENNSNISSTVRYFIGWGYSP